MTELIPYSGPSLHTTCQCWTISREDGVTVRLTEHDRAIEIDGAVFEPGAIIDSGRFTLTSDLVPGEAEVDGAFDADIISEAELTAGLWDGALIEVVRADWKTGQKVSHIWSGRLGQIEHDGARFSASLVSQKSDFSKLIGRAYTRQCDAVLGDSRCKVNLSDPAFANLTCDQSLETCKTRFSNSLNFRGFAHMPGNDFLLAGPGQTQST